MDSKKLREQLAIAISELGIFPKPEIGSIKIKISQKHGNIKAKIAFFVESGDNVYYLLK